MGARTRFKCELIARVPVKRVQYQPPEQLIGKESVVGIVGALCSGATLAAAQGFSIPTGTPMVTPASLSAAITGLLDNDLVYRTIASKDRRLNALALLLEEEASENLYALHTSNHQSVEKFATLTTLLDGERPFEIESHALSPIDQKNAVDQAVVWLEQTEGDLVILDDIVENSPLELILDKALNIPSVRHVYISGDFELESVLRSNVPGDRNKITVVSKARSNEGFTAFSQLANRNGLRPEFPFLANTYDAAFILALAVEYDHVRGSNDISQAIRAVANQPGELIFPGQWAKAIRLIRQGADINYEGASGSIEFDANGDLLDTYVKALVVSGSIQYQEIQN